PTSPTAAKWAGSWPPACTGYAPPAAPRSPHPPWRQPAHEQGAQDRVRPVLPTDGRRPLPALPAAAQAGPGLEITAGVLATDPPRRPHHLLHRPHPAPRVRGR